MPEGPPAHIGTPGSPPQATTNNPGMDLGQQQPGNVQEAARQSSGMKPPAPSQAMGPQTHLMPHMAGVQHSVAGGVG
jgi:hypothetical protein